MNTHADISVRPKTVGILAAGGTGSRLGFSGGKQLLKIAHKPIAAWSAEALLDSKFIDELIVVCDPLRLGEYTQELLPFIDSDKQVMFVAGGDTRQDSVFAGLTQAAQQGADFVVIHDGARPLLKASELDESLTYFYEQTDCQGLIFGHESIDTLKEVESNSEGILSIKGTIDRARYYAVQTPQIFKIDTLIAAHKNAQIEAYVGTDDASLVERSGKALQIWKSSRDNIKVTVPEDVVIAEALLLLRER